MEQVSVVAHLKLLGYGAGVYCRSFKNARGYGAGVYCRQFKNARAMEVSTVAHLKLLGLWSRCLLSFFCQRQLQMRDGTHCTDSLGRFQAQDDVTTFTQSYRCVTVLFLLALGARCC
jgi:hypothetical protein